MQLSILICTLWTALVLAGSGQDRESMNSLARRQFPGLEWWQQFLPGGGKPPAGDIAPDEKPPAGSRFVRFCTNDFEKCRECNIDLPEGDMDLRESEVSPNRFHFHLGFHFDLDRPLLTDGAD